MMKTFSFSISLFLTSLSASYACPRADAEFILSQQNTLAEQVEYYREQSEFFISDIQDTIEILEGTILDQEAFNAFFSDRMAAFVEDRGMQLFSYALCQSTAAEDLEALADFYRSDRGKLWLKHDDHPAAFTRLYLWLYSGAWRHSEYAYLATREYLDAYSALLDEQFEVSNRLFDGAEIAAVVRRKDIVGFADDKFREARARGFEALSSY